jgi:CDP-diacylglycerol---serine O-phosphatidyltransferase
MPLEEKPLLPEENNLSADPTRVRIYFLPNLLTAGNLACGFFALTWIFKYEPGGSSEPIGNAIRLILAAFVFDFFDGRIARLAKKESRFGREFDSLADMVSFGVAPAFLVYRIVLQEFQQTGWLIAAAYLVCGGIRLARFNVLSQRETPGGDKEFLGFPIPSAAALVVSVTMFMLWLTGHERSLGAWRFTLPALMMLLSVLMVSNVRYPTFKDMDWTLQRSVATFATGVVIVLLLAVNFQVALAIVFIAYLLYGLVRPWISKRWRREIEEDEANGDGAES